MNSDSRTVLMQFISFTGVGGVATIFHYVILVILVQLFGIHAVLASATGFITSAFLNYYLNYRLTFSSSKRHRDALTRFFVVALVGLGINTLIMYFLVSNLGLHYLASQVIATAIVLLWNFSGNKLWTFS